MDRENLGISVIQFYTRLAASVRTAPGYVSSRHEAGKGLAEREA
jgi:hypothetical protein